MIVMNQGIQIELLSLEDNLLVALRYQRSIFDFGLTKSTAEHTVPILANFAYLDKDGVPKSHFKISDDSIKGMIKVVRHLIGTVELTEEAVVGYVFEVLSSKMFDQGVFLNISSQSIQIKSLPLTTSRRINSNDEFLLKDMLYRCEKSFVAVDFAVITDVNNVESLLLVQTSVQASMHNNKISKALLLYNIKWKVDGHSSPKQIVYLYLNPMATTDGYDNRSAFFTNLGSRNSTVSGWKYAEIDIASRTELETLFKEAQTNLVFLCN